MDLSAIRRLIIIAVCSDDVLLDMLVLKGGNALNLVHRIGARTSLDVDFSMSEDFENIEEARRRLCRALTDRFDSYGYVVFDCTLVQAPRGELSNPQWGGYRAEFKLLEKITYQQVSDDVGAMRRQAVPITEDGQASRKFKIEISKYEYCEGKEAVELDDYLCYVYTPAMIAAEKLRAICQQMPEYEPRRRKVGRARDFYDIHAIVTARNLNMSAPEYMDLIRHMFEAKHVLLSFLGNISETRAFHAQDWSSVRDTLTEEGLEFDFYFDFVVELVQKLKSLWVV
jgi:Nucleotidyl transferase AbiEii toxin, Type IV TA system